MDWSFLYGWSGYYFLQGFWLDIKLLIAHIDPIPVILAFLVLLSLLLFTERKRIRISSFFLFDYHFLICNVFVDRYNIRKKRRQYQHLGSSFFDI